MSKRSVATALVVTMVMMSFVTWFTIKREEIRLESAPASPLLGMNVVMHDADTEMSKASTTPKTWIPSKEELACIQQENLRPVLSRVIPQWTNCTTKIPADLLEDPTVYTNLPSAMLNKSVYMLAGDNWGQLCNKMGIFAGMFRYMSADLELDMENTVLALSPVYSKTAWALDLAAFSSTVFGVLMDCSACNKTAQPLQLRCSSIVVKGKVYDVSNGYVFTVQGSKEVAELFHQRRPRQLGYMPEMNNIIQPHRALRYLVNELMQHGFLDDSRVSVGLHQRYMDSMCFKWMLDRSQFNCHPTAQFSGEIGKLGAVLHGKKKDYFWNPKNAENGFLLRKITAEARTEFELDHPLLISCNYSLSATQVGILKHDWPVLFQKLPINLLLATDSQTPASERELNAIDFGTVHKLKEYDSCFAKVEYHKMLADMLAMSSTDLHMGNPLSSCDDIVVHWRHARGKSAGSSYPPTCYDGYYTSAK